MQKEWWPSGAVAEAGAKELDCRDYCEKVRRGGNNKRRLYYVETRLKEFLTAHENS